MEEILYLVGKDFLPHAEKNLKEIGAYLDKNLERHYILERESGETAIVYHFRISFSIDEVLELLTKRYFNFIVVDNRRYNHPIDFEDSLAASLLKRLQFQSDPDRMYPASRIMVILDIGTHTAEDAFKLGAYRVGTFLIHPLYANKFYMEVDRLTRARKQKGKVALCLAGGGIEGLLYEIGVCMAMDSFFADFSVVDFDIFCGISAGSMLATLLANGVSADKIYQAFTKTSPIFDPVTPSMVWNISYREYLKRLLNFYKQAAKNPTNLFSVLLKSIPAGFFQGDNIEKYVEDQIARNGLTNDFRKLKKELYIGVTNQDTNEHTVFGDGNYRDIPISQAVKASSALAPFFSPVKVKDKYYVDGQYTRTANFHLAIEKGAKLIIIIDPLIPLEIGEPGYVMSKGGLFTSLQGLKSVIHTRFMTAMRYARDRYPDVDFFIFKPLRESMRIMSGSPMKYTIRTQIIDLAFQSTCQRIESAHEIFSKCFAKRSVELVNLRERRHKHPST